MQADRTALRYGTDLRLGRPARRGAELGHLGRRVEALRLDGRWHEVTGTARLEHLAHLLHAHAGHALHVLRRQLGLAIFLALSQRHVQRLRDEDAAIHFRNGLGRFLGRREADEAEA